MWFFYWYSHWELQMQVRLNLGWYLFELANLEIIISFLSLKYDVAYCDTYDWKYK